MQDRTDDIVALMKEGYRKGYQHISRERLAQFVRCEWESNRWAMVVDEQDTNKLLGWISWYTLDDNSLANVQENGILGCFHKNIALNSGENLYLCNAVVRQGEPSGVFRLLMSMAKQANPEARTISAHLRNRDDPAFRWATFRLPGKKRLEQESENEQRTKS